MGAALRNLALFHLERRPEEAARVLARCSTGEAAALLRHAAPAASARALATLAPRLASDCFAELPGASQAGVLNELSPPPAAALLRSCPSAVREASLARLAAGVAARIRDAMRYPPDSPGASAVPTVTLFGDQRTAHAIESLGALPGPVPDRVLVLDRSRRVLGALPTAALCWSPPDGTVGSLALQPVPTIPARTPVATLAGDRGLDGASAPVVDRSGAFLGVLNPESLRRAVPQGPARPLTHLAAAFSELCWFGLTAVLGGLTAATASSRRAETGPRRA